MAGSGEMLVFGTIAEDYRPTRTQREAAKLDALDLGVTLDKRAAARRPISIANAA
jgi:hypothetical protein